MGQYTRFGAMIATSTALMLGLMYLNTYAFDHIYWSETRAYMALVMGAAMAFVMLAFMLGMYENTKVNAAIFVAAILVFSGSLYLVRSQETIDDVSWMKAVIPIRCLSQANQQLACLAIVEGMFESIGDEFIDEQTQLHRPVS